MLIEMLIKPVSLGGNLLMNVGPCARGYFDSRAVAALKIYGDWMKYNGRSIYGCTMAEPEFEAPQGTLLTQSEDGSRLYVHLLSYPFKRLSMKGLSDRILYAQFLHDASEIRYAVQHETVSGDVGGLLSGRDMVFFALPVVRPNITVPVIEIVLKPGT
jgi:alpha-L-fucosidase